MTEIKRPKKFFLIALAATPAFIFFTSGILTDFQKDTNAKIKAIFIYNFTKYFDWPAEYKKGEFVIAVYGSTTLLPELRKMAAVQSVGSQKIVVTNPTSTGLIAKCHIMYVAPDMSSRIGEVISKTKTYSTLLITDQNGLAKKGAAINFIIINNKQKFELNAANAKKYNLKVSSRLYPLAKVVE